MDQEDLTVMYLAAVLNILYIVEFFSITLGLAAIEKWVLCNATVENRRSREFDFYFRLHTNKTFRSDDPHSSTLQQNVLLERSNFRRWNRLHDNLSFINAMLVHPTNTLVYL